MVVADLLKKCQLPVAVQIQVRVNATLLSHQKLVFSKPQARLDKLNDRDQRLILLVQNLEEEFDE